VNPIRVTPFHHHLVEAVIVGIVLFHSQLIGHPKTDQHGAGKTNGESQQVQQGETAIFHEVTPGDLPIVFQHKRAIMHHPVQSKDRIFRMLFVNALSKWAERPVSETGHWVYGKEGQTKAPKMGLVILSIEMNALF
jgi:hypothetical protein